MHKRWGSSTLPHKSALFKTNSCIFLKILTKSFISSYATAFTEFETRSSNERASTNPRDHLWWETMAIALLSLAIRLRERWGILSFASPGRPLVWLSNGTNGTLAPNLMRSNVQVLFSVQTCLCLSTSPPFVLNLWMVKLVNYLINEMTHLFSRMSNLLDWMFCPRLVCATFWCLLPFPSLSHRIRSRDTFLCAFRSPNQRKSEQNFRYKFNTAGISMTWFFYHKIKAGISTRMVRKKNSSIYFPHMKIVSRVRNSVLPYRANFRNIILTRVRNPWFTSLTNHNCVARILTNDCTCTYV